MSEKPIKFHFDTTGDDTDNIDVHTSYTGVDPYELGYATAIEEVQKYLKALGEALCFLLEIAKDNQISVTWTVSEECELKFTISKEV